MNLNHGTARMFPPQQPAATAPAPSPNNDMIEANPAGPSVLNCNNDTEAAGLAGAAAANLNRSGPRHAVQDDDDDYGVIQLHDLGSTATVKVTACLLYTSPSPRDS